MIFSIFYAVQFYCDLINFQCIIFMRPSWDIHIMWLGMVGGRPHSFPHNNFSSVYRIFTKLGHTIPLCKGKNPIYFGVIRSKVKVTINIIFDNRVVSSVYWIFNKLGYMIPLWKGKNPIYFGVIRSRSPLL